MMTEAVQAATAAEQKPVTDVKQALAAALGLPDYPGVIDQTLQAHLIREQWARLDVDAPLMAEAVHVGKQSQGLNDQIRALLGDLMPEEVAQRLARRCDLLDAELSGMIAWYSRGRLGIEEQIRAALGVPVTGEMFPGCA